MSDSKTQQQNENPKQDKEQPATVGDLCSLGIVAAVVAGIVKSDSTPQRHGSNKSKVVNVDSLVNDSLSKTIEYQNAERTTRDLENRRTGIYEYFNEQLKQ